MQQGTEHKGSDDLNRIIERAKRELEQMIDMTPDVMFLLDTRGTILRANRALLNLLGASQFNAVIGRPVAEIFQLKNPAEISRFLAGTEPRAELMLKADIGGRTRDLEFTVMPAGQAAGWRVAFVEDVEEERRKTETLEEQCRKEAARTLVCTLMHNLNQPLTVITIRCQLLLLSLNKGSLNPDELKKGLEEISELTMQVANTLSRAQSFRDFVTTPYTEHSAIVDLPQSIGDK